MTQLVRQLESFVPSFKNTVMKAFPNVELNAMHRQLQSS